MKIRATGEELSDAEAAALVAGGFLRYNNGELDIVVEESDLVPLANRMRAERVSHMIVDEDIAYAFSDEAWKGRAAVCQ